MEPKNFTYRLEEMSEAMENSLGNLTKVIGDQEMLIEVVKNSDKVEFFKEFLEESSEQVENFKSQKDKLKSKKELLDDVIANCHEDSQVETVVTNLLLALGVFNND